MSNELSTIEQRLMRLLDEMVEQQRHRMWVIANRIQPGLSEDDLRDPHSFPQVNTRPEFTFEDGQLAGLISAQVAVQRELGEHARTTTPDNGAAT